MYKTGFTLVELSIVLVIIGLLAGGILVGRDMLRVAELRADITLKERMETAALTFQSKYNCLPGDCGNASDFFTGAHNGDGDGIVAVDHDPVNPNNYSLFLPNNGTHIDLEPLYANDHLARAAMIPLASFDPLATSLEPGIVMPKLKSSEAGLLIGCYHNAVDGTIIQCHYFLMGVSGMENGFALSTDPPVYKHSDAYYIDSKLDDGAALEGSVISANSTNYIQNGPQFVITTEGNGRCASYDFTVTTHECTLLVRASF